MPSRTLSCAVSGLAGVPVTVEADVANGLPAFTVVGLTDRAIQEARERVRAAIRNSGFTFPARRVTVNLAPAEVPKEGSCYDLAIAVSVIGAVSPDLPLAGTAFLGELTLDGAVRPVSGVLPRARCLQEAGVRRLIVARGNGEEAALVAGLEVVAVPTLSACVGHLLGASPLPQVRGGPPASSGCQGPDLADVRGQAQARRVLEIAAAGAHNLLMVGPPGSGKTMLGRAFPSLLPDLELDHSLEVAAIHSVRGLLGARLPTEVRPPLRAPHHSVSRTGLIGGGPGLARPGEISLAHRGVLFLDEVCEFPRSHLEALRQPLEEGSVTIVRSGGGVTLPARFLLLAAGNPCPCGFRGDPVRPCGCEPRAVAGYRARLSAPLRDRIDLEVAVPRQSPDRLVGTTAGESSAGVRARVEAARRRAELRRHQAGGAGGDPAWLAEFRPSAAALGLARSAAQRLGLSARALFGVLRVARTIADLAAEELVSEASVAESLRYRAGGGP